jgi:EAL domain-containing protein (putative c-di-GMP-specific phosphodiesterase class I)
MALTTTISDYWIRARTKTGSLWMFSFAFQPIVDARTRSVVSYEALVRGPRREKPAHLFSKVPKRDLIRFHHLCHVRAIQVASRLNIHTDLNLNLFTDGPEATRVSIRLALQEAVRHDLPARNLVFEVSESDRELDYGRVTALFSSNARYGYQTAIDDFGTGYSGLKLLVEFQPSYIKLDRRLIAHVHEDRIRQTVVRGLLQICRNLGVQVVAEGVEVAEEFGWLHSEGVDMFQGYYFARPAFEELPQVPAHLFSV